MALAFTNLSWWLWNGKQKEPRISSGTCLNSSPESGVRESDALKFPSVKGANIASSSRKVKRKWHSREERKIDKEYDGVLVPSDGECVSGSESDSDWSIGWLEPHGPGFQSDDDADDSFAVLVPCYGHAVHDMVGKSKNRDQNTIGSIPDGKCFSFRTWFFSVHRFSTFSSFPSMLFCCSTLRNTYYSLYELLASNLNVKCLTPFEFFMA